MVDILLCELVESKFEVRGFILLHPIQMDTPQVVQTDTLLSLKQVTRYIFIVELLTLDTL